MILVVADTGPLHYRVLIQAVEVLSRLYDRVIVPQAVYRELIHPNAPHPVRNWATTLPSWAEVRSASQAYTNPDLDPSEVEAIALARELKADSLLLDETEARREAVRLGLPVSGTIGVLEKASEREWINLPEFIERLSRTNFHVSPANCSNRRFNVMQPAAKDVNAIAISNGESCRSRARRIG